MHNLLGDCASLLQCGWRGLKPEMFVSVFCARHPVTVDRNIISSELIIYS
jgi:hypothetical protein